MIAYHKLVIWKRWFFSCESFFFRWRTCTTSYTNAIKRIRSNNARHADGWRMTEVSIVRTVEFLLYVFWFGSCENRRKPQLHRNRKNTECRRTIRFSSRDTDDSCFHRFRFECFTAVVFAFFECHVHGRRSPTCFATRTTPDVQHAVTDR